MTKISTYTTTAALILLAFMPVVLFAQTNKADFGELTGFVGKISGFINNTLIPLVFAIALLVFLYGIFTYFILGGHDPEKQEKGRGLMLYSIIGFVLMVSIFGIVNLISNGLGFSGGGNENIKNIPNVPTSNTGGGST